MNHSPRTRLCRTALLAGMLATVCLLGGCGRDLNHRLQGYVEGEYVYVSAPLPGALVALSVERGSEVQAGEALFELESVVEAAAKDEAQQRLAQAQAIVADLRKGRRPSEIESLEAQLKQARAALALAEAELGRQTSLAHTQAIADQDVERAQSTRDQAAQRVVQLEADLKSGTLGARADQIAAAEAEVAVREAALVRAGWELAEKRQTAPQSGLVFDTIYRPGEWVPAGRPVVVVLPPENIKVRAFVPEHRIGTVQAGDAVRVTVDGESAPVEGRVSFIAPQAEYTPPVIYSRENRSKLVFMIEVAFDAATARRLHPGQPVDVTFKR